MTAWTNLLAASSLTEGTAWELLDSPLTGTGTGPGSTVVVDSITMQIDPQPTMDTDSTPTIIIFDDQASVEAAFDTSLATNPTTIEVTS